MQIKKPSNVQVLGILVMTLGIVLAFADGIEHLPGNLASEAIGIAVTVLVIDWLYARQTEGSEKRQILDQMGSSSNDFALEAVCLALKRGWLHDGSLKRIDLSGANLSGANLSGANLSGADLSEAKLIGADLSEANLSRADLSKADLQGKATLHKAILEGSKLSEAKLVWADLSEANLSRADLSKADLSEAKLVGADLSGADLHEALLFEADMSDTKYTHQTRWPEEFVPSPTGTILKD